MVKWKCGSISENLLCLFLPSTSPPSTSKLHFLIYNAALVSAFVLSRLDYRNSVLAVFNLPAVTVKPLQRVMNAAVRLVAGLGWRYHITHAMRDLHWLPIVYRLKYKLCILMHAATNSYSSEYITKISVRNSKTEFGKRAFCVTGLTAWNELLPELRHMPDIQIFKRAFKHPSLQCRLWLLGF